MPSSAPSFSVISTIRLSTSTWARRWSSRSITLRRLRYMGSGAEMISVLVVASAFTVTPLAEKAEPSCPLRPVAPGPSVRAPAAVAAAAALPVPLFWPEPEPLAPAVFACWPLVLPELLPRPPPKARPAPARARRRRCCRRRRRFPGQDAAQHARQVRGLGVAQVDHVQVVRVSLRAVQLADQVARQLGAAGAAGAHDHAVGARVGDHDDALARVLVALRVQQFRGHAGDIHGDALPHLDTSVTSDEGLSMLAMMRPIDPGCQHSR